MGKVYMMPGGDGVSVDPPCLIYIDNDGNPQIAKIRNINELCVYSGPLVIDGKTINRDRIISVYLDGLSVTTIPDHFCNYYSSLIILSGLPDELTSIGNDFMTECKAFNSILSIPNGVKSIGNYFLDRCISFNQRLDLPIDLVTIGSNFMNGCSSFNNYVILPDGIKTIGSYFLNGCDSCQTSLVLPASLTSLGSDFLRHCDLFKAVVVNANPTWSGDDYSMSTSNVFASIYTTGIWIYGNYASQFKSKYPDKTAAPFRKLLTL